MKPWTTGQVYLNFIGDEGQARVETAYELNHRFRPLEFGVLALFVGPQARTHGATRPDSTVQPPGVAPLR